MGCDKQENYGLKIFGLYFSRINSSNVQDECIFTLFDEDTNTDIDVVLFVDDFLTSSRNGHSSNHILNKEKYRSLSNNSFRNSFWNEMGDITYGRNQNFTTGYIAKIFGYTVHPVFVEYDLDCIVPILVTISVLSEDKELAHLQKDIIFALKMIFDWTTKFIQSSNCSKIISLLLWAWNVELIDRQTWESGQCESDVTE